MVPLGCRSVKHYVAVVLALTVGIASCGSGGDVSTTSVVDRTLPGRPDLAVDQMVAALMLGDVEVIRQLTSDRQLAIIVALEGGGTEELAAMLQSGVPDDVAVNFWTSFVGGFPDLVGESIEDMDFGTSVPQRVQGVEFVSFPVAFGTATAGTEWFTRSTATGWEIDLLATFGGPFASALESLVRRTTDPVVLETIRGERASFEAAYQRHADLGSNVRVQAALMSLLDLLSS